MGGDCRVKNKDAAVAAVEAMLGETLVGVINETSTEYYRPTSPLVSAHAKAAGVNHPAMDLADGDYQDVAQWLRSIADFLDPQGGGRE
jgi:hypothetical protein